MSEDHHNCDANNDPLTFVQAASQFAEKSQWDAALSFCQKALDADPNIELAGYLAGIACVQLGRSSDAVHYLKAAISTDEDDIAKLGILIALLQEARRSEDAIPYLRRHVELEPGVENLNRLAAAYADIGHLGEAIQTFRQSLTLSPKNNIASAGLYPLLRLTCEWGEELDGLSQQIDALNAEALSHDQVAPEPPFDNIHRCNDEAVNLAVAQSWSKALTDRTADVASFTTRMRAQKDGIIRIGYLSADFHDHATAHLMRGVFQAHDQDRFRVTAYSYGPDDGSQYRADIRKACHDFIDVTGISDREAASKIHEDKIDILVDLKGHTRRNRLAICAMRPAPLQVTYLGFPGTSGAPFFDYAITDRTVTPKNSYQYYTENLVILENSYQCNDDKQYIPEKNTLKDIENFDIILCSFNNPIKLEISFFEIWMLLLSNIKNSCLWVLQNNDAAKENLRKIADRYGMARRLIFAEMLPRRQHLERMACADLALDTRYYNGHTTTSDALWAGLPVVTLEGEHFASRVSASLLRAMDLPELITSTTKGYADRVIELANDGEMRAAIKQKIENNRSRAPLFDTAQFTRTLETAYTEIFRRHCAGEAPSLLDYSG